MSDAGDKYPSRSGPWLVATNPSQPPRQVVILLLDVHGSWLKNAARSVSRRHAVDEDDLRQELLLRLLMSTTPVDPNNPGVRTWLRRKLEWTASDMSRPRRQEDCLDPVDLTLWSTTTTCPTYLGPLDDDAAGGASTSVNRQSLIAFGCTENEAQTLMFLIDGFDTRLSDWAGKVGRSYACVRKEKSRGLQHIEHLLNLTEEETSAMRAVRHHDSVERAAAATGISTAEFTAVLDGARTKIVRFFDDALAGPADQHVWQRVQQWGVTSLGDVPKLLACINARVEFYEDPSKFALYRPNPNIARNRLALVLHGPDDVIGDRKTWTENGARVWRDVYEEMKKVVPTLSRPEPPGAKGATQALRSFYRDLRLLDAHRRGARLSS